MKLTPEHLHEKLQDFFHRFRSPHFNLKTQHPVALKTVLALLLAGSSITLNAPADNPTNYPDQLATTTNTLQILDKKDYSHFTSAQIRQQHALDLNRYQILLSQMVPDRLIILVNRIDSANDTTAVITHVRNHVPLIDASNDSNRALLYKWQGNLIDDRLGSMIWLKLVPDSVYRKKAPVAHKTITRQGEVSATQQHSGNILTCLISPNMPDITMDYAASRLIGLPNTLGLFRLNAFETLTSDDINRFVIWHETGHCDSSDSYIKTRTTDAHSDYKRYTSEYWADLHGLIGLTWENGGDVDTSRQIAELRALKSWIAAHKSLDDANSKIAFAYHHGEELIAATAMLEEKLQDRRFKARFLKHGPKDFTELANDLYMETVLSEADFIKRSKNHHDSLQNPDVIAPNPDIGWIENMQRIAARYLSDPENIQKPASTLRMNASPNRKIAPQRFSR